MGDAHLTFPIFALCSSLLATAPPWTASSGGVEAEVSSSGRACFAEGRTSPCLQTVAARRGSRPLDIFLVRRSTSPFQATLLRRAFTETIGVGVSGFEQAFHFAAAPTGQGELVIELEATRETPRARGRSLSLGTVTYGDAVWVDSAGLRAPVKLSVRRDRVVLTVSAAILERTRWPAVLDPAISADFPVGSLPDGGNAGTGGGGGSTGGLAFTSQPTTRASCNVAWRYEPTTDAMGAVTFSLRGVDGSALPASLFQNPATGALFWQPKVAGPSSFELVASSRGARAVQRVDVEVSCLPYQVGCGCSAVDGSMLVALGLLLLARRRAYSRASCLRAASAAT